MVTWSTVHFSKQNRQPSLIIVIFATSQKKRARLLTCHLRIQRTVTITMRSKFYSTSQQLYHASSPIWKHTSSSDRGKHVQMCRIEIPPIITYICHDTIWRRKPDRWWVVSYQRPKRPDELRSDTLGLVALIKTEKRTRNSKKCNVISPRHEGKLLLWVKG